MRKLWLTCCIACRSRKHPREDAPGPATSTPAAHLVSIPAGTATLGLPRTEDTQFGWDNEFEEFQVQVPEFEIDAYKVSNRDFLHFMANGGYQERSLWDDSAWQWLQSNDVTHPAFWLLRGNHIFLRTMFHEIPLPLDWPVYVSHAEASAYARWAGKELPTEAEWHRAAYGTHEGIGREFPWGHASPDHSRGNFDFSRWNPVSVSAFPAGTSAFGVAGLLGNGWEWTSTPFAPFPGFEAFPFYPGYSANFFDGRHYVLKGASSRTAACMLRRSLRNWFQPHYPFIYAGFRCVKH
jgi:gamma-glutamyl hercynylcysteine S-oxide synthase